MVGDPGALQGDLGFIRTLIASGSGEASINCYFAGLLRDPGIRAAYLRDLLPGLGEASLDGAVVCAEDDSATSKGVPDISIIVGSQVRVLVENKLDAAFTDNQPHAYLKALAEWKREHETGTAALVIHAPDARLNLLARDTWERIGSRSATKDLVRNGDLCGGVLVKLVGWSAVERVFSAHLPAVSDPVLVFLLRSFLHLLPPALSTLSRPITKEHVMHLNDRSVLEAFAAVQDLLRDVRVLLSRDHKHSADCDLHGAEIKFLPRNSDGSLDMGREFYVGVCARVGANFGMSPLMIHLTGEDYTAIDAVRQSGRRVVDGSDLAVLGWEERPLVPLDLQPDLDPPEQARRVVETIGTILKLALGT